MIKNITKFNDKNIEDIFNNYPEKIREKLLFVREIIYEVAKKSKYIWKIEETLKWGEPSYLTKNGSTVRIDWKKKNKNQYSMFFNCKTRLIETFRELFSDRFTFEGNREIIFQKDENFDVKSLEYCILLALTYHDRKHLRMLDD